MSSKFFKIQLSNDWLLKEFSHRAAFKSTQNDKSTLIYNLKWEASAMTAFFQWKH